MIQSDMWLSPREILFHGSINAKQEHTFGRNDLVYFWLSPRVPQVLFSMCLFYLLHVYGINALGHYIQLIILPSL